MTTKQRFEVFKRDKFTCAYCGRKAPDVVLHVDHIHPKSKGGASSLLNYVTACSDCNLGKGATPLSDDSALAKQRAQLDVLTERREQLEMLMRWQEELLGLQDEAVARVAHLWNGFTPGRHLSEHGMADLRKMIRRFGIEEVCEAMQIARDSYLRFAKDGDCTEESWNHAWSKIPGICVIRERKKADPDADKPGYICGIIIKRGLYINEGAFWDLMKETKHQKVPWGDIIDLACHARNWTEFYQSALGIVDSYDPPLH